MGKNKNAIRMTQQHFCKCLLTLLVTGVGTASGQALVDPMRPAEIPDQAPARERRVSEPGVRVILTSPERSLAVIDGKVVAVGEEVRGGTLVGLTDSAAVLRKDGGRDVLLMHPDIEKRPAR